MINLSVFYEILAAIYIMCCIISVSMKVGYVVSIVTFLLSMIYYIKSFKTENNMQPIHISISNFVVKKDATEDGVNDARDKPEKEDEQGDDQGCS